MSVGEPGDVGFTGTFPPQLPPGGTTIQNAGSATGLFPTIGPSAAPGSRSTAEGAVAVDYASGMPLAPAGLIVGLALAALGTGLAAPGMYRRHRDNSGS